LLEWDEAVPDMPSGPPSHPIMKTALPFVAAAALISLPACKKSGTDSPATPPPAATLEQKVAEGPEAAAREAVKIQEELAAVMETITDAASAEQAIAKLGPIAEKFAIVAKAANGMDQKMSAEQDAELKELLKPSQARLTAAMERAMPIIAKHPEIAQKMQDAMSKMAP
jgi:hypothetical protein